MNFLTKMKSSETSKVSVGGKRVPMATLDRKQRTVEALVVVWTRPVLLPD